MFCCYSLIWYVGSLFIEAGVLGFQDLSRAYFAIVLASRGSGIASAQAADTAKAESAKRNIFALIDRKSPIDPLAGPPPAPQFQPLTQGEACREAPGAPTAVPVGPFTLAPIRTIVFEHVTFSYPTREAPALMDICLTLHPGQRVGVCGPSGSGKSTIIALLERFYDPQQGRILVDGTDIRGIPVRQLRRRLALVSQMPVLMSGTVSENVMYGQEGADTGEERVGAGDAEPLAVVPTGAEVPADGVAAQSTFAAASIAAQPRIRSALQSANALDFIQSLPAGVSTQVGFGGGQLSGGQRQRVAIARAIAREPDVLLLDEATAALDTASESVVAAALERIVRQRGAAAAAAAASSTPAVTAAAEGGRGITLNVAHRLSSIATCDRILVIDRGRLVEDGPHEELMRRSRGLYRQLVLAQNAGAGVP